MTSLEAKNLAEQNLGSARFLHTCNVADAAAALAQRYGADVETARTAGYLHDLLKEKPKSDLLQIIEGFDIIIAAEIKPCPALYHAFAGGIYAKNELNLSDEISDSIMYHTTGRAGMTLMDRIIYLADYISAERDFEGVDAVRALAEQDLDAALFAAMKAQLIHLSSTESFIDSRSVDAYNDLLMGVKYD